MSNAEFPPFKLGAPRFDQSSFGGRLRHFLDITDPRTLFTSKAKLEESIKLIDDYKNGQLDPGVNDETLWKAQKIKQAIIHPDTGEKIWMPFRMSGFVPFGSPIVVGLLLPNLSLPGTVFWQWLNQTHNACVNYSNRNASKPTPMKRFVLGYTGAVTTACTIAVGLTLLIRRANKLSAAKKMLIQKFVPFPAVASASVCNVVLMRNSELIEGITVFDKDGRAIGSSKVAAKKALKETAATRAVLPAPILLIPPVTMALLEKTSFLMRKPRFHLPFNAAVTTLAFAVALPIAIALFPQISQVNRQDLEPELQEATEDMTLFYNKGL